MTEQYRRLLENWVRSQKPYLGTPSDRPDLMFYGTGTHKWGIQTHMKGFSAYAVLAADPDTDETRCGMTRAELLDTALKLLRFTLESNVTGSYHCMDGEGVNWGRHWLASLAIERMMHGVDAISVYLTDNDRKRLREVLIDECDWITDNRPVEADPVSPNVPESNLWSGAILWRTALSYPGAPRADEYREHGTHLLLNAVSVPSDRECTVIYDGKPVSAWFEGANYFESYACNHHGYLNVGYMVICLSNMAMLHFSCKRAGMKAPDALYRHFADLWRFVRTCVFDDGRLFRIGGDMRVRYCYCQDYLIPVFALVRDVLGEDTEPEERGWLSIIGKETAANGDGSFLSERLELFRERSPLYYTRLESDRACTLSMMCCWHRVFPEIFEKTAERSPKNQCWCDAYHGGFYVRGENRMASFVWISAERPQGGVVPPSDSSMAESRRNMTGYLEGGGISNPIEQKEYGGRLFDGGFITGGRFRNLTKGLLEENDDMNCNAETKLVFCALPDDRTVVTLQLCTALRRCWLVSASPLNYQMPNDIFNGSVRTYREEGNSLTSDEKLTFTLAYSGIPGETLRVKKGTARTIGLMHGMTDTVVYKDRGMLRVDNILVGGSEVPRWYDIHTKIFDFGAAVRTDNQAAETEAFSDGDVRAVRVRGDDGVSYTVVSNFGTENAEFSAFGIRRTLSAGEYAVFAEDKELRGNTIS